MSTHIIKVPDLGEGIAEVELVAWHVAPGDEVVEDQPLADVMTDKATVEIPSPVTGKVVSLGGEPGQVMAVGADLIHIETGDASRGAEAQAAAQTPGRPDGGATRAPDRDSIAQAGTESPDAPNALKTPDVPDTPHAAQAPDAAEDRDALSSGAAQAGHVTQETSPALGRKQGQESGQEQRQGQERKQEQEAPLASPAVRRHARELGISLRAVQGTGPGGRILHQDLDAFATHAADKAAARGTTPPMPHAATVQTAPVLAGAVSRDADTAGVQAIPLVGLRRRIAQRMQDTLRIPHFTYVEEVDVTEVERLRAELNERFGAERGHLGLLPLLVRAVATAIRGFPQMNARFDDEAGVITQFAAVHMGIATHTPGGLVVPVLRNAQTRSVWSIAADIAELAAAAREGRATREQLSGSTITITSLGALGGIMSTPVINRPEVAIIGINRIVERPVFRDGIVVPRKLMNLSSSFDHRVIDGMPAAEFVQTVRRLLESPGLLFVE